MIEIKREVVKCECAKFYENLNKTKDVIAV